MQVRHENCWGRPRCVCAVAARSGQDVFTIDACYRRQYINFPICKENSLKVIKETDKVYKVDFNLLSMGFFYFWFLILLNQPFFCFLSSVNTLASKESITLCSNNFDASFVHDFNFSLRSYFQPEHLLKSSFTTTVALSGT